MKRGKNVLDRIRDATDLSTEVLPGQTLLELLGDRRVLIEHHSGVTEYNSHKIQVRVKFGYLCVCGTGLTLSKMSSEQLVIAGRISSVSIIRGR